MALDLHASVLIYLQPCSYIFNQGYLVVLTITNTGTRC